MTDDELVAYLAGATDSLPADADVARVQRTHELLGEPALWAEPSPDLEQRVIAAVLGDRPAVAIPIGRTRRSPRRWVRNSLVAAAAAAVLAIGGVAIVNGQRDQPMQFAATLQGTELAPAATGSVTMTKTASGWRIHLQAKGLPRLDGGSYYQGWLKNAAGTLVPIGTFNQGDDVTLWSGVPPTDFPTLTITRQQASAGPASSGQKVLGGATHRTH
jgi:hypothetical protein